MDQAVLCRITSSIEFRDRISLRIINEAGSVYDDFYAQIAVGVHQVIFPYCIMLGASATTHSNVLQSKD